jgi:FAD/FMN-containing dehydrogenase
MNCSKPRHRPALILTLVVATSTQLAAQEHPNTAPSLLLNDVHSRLNPTQVAEIVHPRSVDEVIAAVKRAKAEGRSISISGARHSMGGQQFAKDALHLDMRGLNRFIAVDRDKKLARVEAGITWPVLLDALEKSQGGHLFLTFTQKQTGADELTLGGAVSSNIHGRGLQWRPFVQDIESLTLVDADGALRKASRSENPELFSLVVGGYGLFGVIVEVEIRLVMRQRLERVVEITKLDGLISRINGRIEEKFLLGDFQFCPDESSPKFLREGVFSCYRPVKIVEPLADVKVTLRPESWRKLIATAHQDKATAWSTYTAHYLLTHGQHYWHDRAQFNHYDPDYEERIEAVLPNLAPGSLMISEVYVPRERLEDFMVACATDFREHMTNVIYGTIRFIKKDGESFLAWARDDFACIVFNLRVTHTDQGKTKAQEDFRRLIDRALERGGSFFLTYHRWATKEQMLQAYPQFSKFLELKRKFDPTERFQSEWYRHWRDVLRRAE